MKVSSMVKIKSVRATLFLLPVVSLIASVLMNLDKFSESIMKASVHSILQAFLIYGLLAVSRKWIPLRWLTALFVVIPLFLGVTYDSSLSLSIMMSILNSPPSEAADFIEFNLPALLVSGLVFLGMVMLPVLPGKRATALSLGIGLAYLVLPTLISSHELLASEKYFHHVRTGLARGYSTSYATAEYLTEETSWRFPPLKSISGIVDTITFLSYKAELSSSWTNVTSDNSNNLLILGIGESLRKDNMGIYGYARNTTPELSSISGMLGIFTNAYSGGTNTWTSVPAMLTLSRDRPDLSKSIINLAKDAGYKTYWLSNQARFSKNDLSVSSIADQSDHVFFVSSDKAGEEYDVVLLLKLAELLLERKTDEKTLIVLNFYGSHMTFSNRYPPEYARFSGHNRLLDEYDNSVLYTDHIQREVIRLISEHRGKYLFFSDHGLGAPDSNIPLMHDIRDTPSIDSLMVPLLLYPKEQLKIDTKDIISLYYLECLFSEWSGISATELRGGYCKEAMNSGKVRFVDANLVPQTVSPDTE